MTIFKMEIQWFMFLSFFFFKKKMAKNKKKKKRKKPIENMML
jgi:hypothetical protein